MLFKKYLKVREFPKKERTKSLQPLRFLLSILYLNLSIMFKIYLNMLYITY